MTQAQPGDEGRRQAYLAALGIPLWSARIGLPGALPSAPLAFVPYVAEAAPVAPTPAVPTDHDAAASAPRQAAGVAPATAPAAAARHAGASATGGAVAPGLAQGAAGPSFAPAPAPASRPAASAASAATAANATNAAAGDTSRRPPQDERFPRLSCRAWRLAPGLSAVIALDDAPDLSAAEYRLLDNIARALDADEMPAATGELLRWPLNRNPALDHGPEALHAWLGHALRLPPGPCVVFGEALAVHVAAALPSATVLTAPALGELLADAGAKRRLWQALHG